MLAVDDVRGFSGGADLAQGLEGELWILEVTIALEPWLGEELLEHGAVLAPLLGVIAEAESAVDVSQGLLLL